MTLWPLPSRPICNNQTLEFFGCGTENNANPLPRCSRQDTDHLQCLCGLWIWRFPFPCYPENKRFQLGGTNLPKSSSRHPPDAESLVFSCCCTGQPWLGDTGAGSPCEHGFTSPCRQWCWVIYLKSRPQGAWPEPRLSRLTLFAQDLWGTARDYGEVSQRSWFQAFFHQTAPTSLLFKDFFFFFMWTGLLLAGNFLGKTFLFVHRGTAALKLLLPAWFLLWPEPCSEQDCDLFSLDKLNDEKKKSQHFFFFFF